MNTPDDRAYSSAVFTALCRSTTRERALVLMDRHALSVLAAWRAGSEPGDTADEILSLSAVVSVGWDGRSQPMWRYTADLPLPDHARRVVAAIDRPEVSR